MDACLLFHTGNHLQINLCNRLPVQHRIQKNVQLKNTFCIQLLTDRNQSVPDDIAFSDDNSQNLIRIHLRQLNKFQFVLVILRRRNHCGIIGIAGKHLHNLLQHLLHFICPPNHQLLQLCDLAVLFLYQMIYIQTISLIGRNPAC